MAVDAERLRTEGVYQAKAPLREISEDLDKIASAIGRWRALRRSLAKMGLVLVIAAIGLVIAGAATRSPAVAMTGILAGVLAVALFIYAARYARDCCKRASRIIQLRELGEMLRTDAAPDTPTEVTLAFRPRKVLLKEEPFARHKKGKEKFFSDAWLALETELLDRTTFIQRISDVIRERSYVNPRGKHKTNTRTRCLVSLRLCYPAEVYGDLSGSPSRLRQDIRLNRGAILRGVRVTDRDIKLKAVVEKVEDLKTATAPLALGAYRILNYGRKVTRTRGRSGGAA